MAPSLPTVSLLALPLVTLPPQVARDIWLWFNLLILLIAIGLLLATAYYLNCRRQQDGGGLAKPSQKLDFKPESLDSSGELAQDQLPGRSTINWTITDYDLNRDNPQTTWWLTFTVLAFIFPPVAANFFVGQAIILFFGLFVLALFGLVSRRDGLAGLALGLAFILKTTG